MSLLCGECDRNIIYGEPLHLAVSDHTPAQGGVAVCVDCLKRVPARARQRATEGRTGGLMIHDAMSTRNFNGSYTWSGLERGAPHWWITQDTALRWLPRLSSECDLAPKPASNAPTRRGGLEVQIVLLEGVPTDSGTAPRSRGRKQRTRAERERDERVEAIYQAFRRGGFRP